MNQGSFFLPPPQTGIEHIFSDFFQKRPNYVILFVHIVFQDDFEVAEHISGNILIRYSLFGSLRRLKVTE